MAQKRIILRHPEGVSIIETDDELALMQCFIKWIIFTNHFSRHEESENEDIFTFVRASYVAACNVKWRKLCSNLQ